MGRLSVSLCGIELDNPIIPASGTFGYGHEFAALYDINCLGTFSFKGTTLRPRFGNVAPRIAEAPGGMLNAVGLQNPGVDAVIREELPRLAKCFHKPVIANVSGFSVEEYAQCAAQLEAEDLVGIIELNVSCPNVHGGGMSFGTDPATAVSVLRAVKAVCRKPVYVKCTPQCPDLPGMCRALEEAGADGLVLCNTFLGTRLSLATGKPILANGTGGVSGPGIFPQALCRVWQIAPLVHIPIVGCGGVSCAEDAIEMLSAGASAVEIGTQNLVDPLCIPRILRDLERILDRLGVTDINEIIGRSHK